MDCAGETDGLGTQEPALRAAYQALTPADRSTEYGGIPVFLHFSTIDAELSGYPNEKRAVELARTGGWREALRSVYDQAMVAYCTDPKRTTFLDVLPLSPQMAALEIGTGLGQNTVALAARVRRLDTLEVHLLNAMFTKIRCEQEGAANVTFTCGGDDCRLPFPDRTYDAVILNLVLEWCASGNPHEPGVAGQRRLLAEIRRVLKPGGFLQLSTKNRFSYRLLIGGRDEHAYGLPFGSALPRWLLRLILRLPGNGHPPGYLHSYGALRRLLHSCGLSPSESYWAVPEMRFPEAFIPTDAKAIRAARRRSFRQGETRASALLMRITPASLVRYFTPGLFFIARKA